MSEDEVVADETAAGPDLFDRELDGERLREVEALLAEVEAELTELDPPGPGS